MLILEVGLYRLGENTYADDCAKRRHQSVWKHSRESVLLTLAPLARESKWKSDKVR